VVSSQTKDITVATSVNMNLNGRCERDVEGMIGTGLYDYFVLSKKKRLGLSHKITAIANPLQ
jgi:hypothetical protein